MAISLTGLRKTFLSPAFILRSLPVGVVIAVGVLASIWTHALLDNHEALVSHTYQVIDTTKDVLIALDDAETGERGYVISGDIKRLEPYEKALGRLAQLRLDLARRISDNPEQRARVESLNDLIDQKLAELKQSIKTRGNGDSEASQELEVAIMQRATMDIIRPVIGHITDAEKSLLTTRQSKVETDEYRVKLVAIIIALLSFLVRAGIEIYLVNKGAENVA